MTFQKPSDLKRLILCALPRIHTDFDLDRYLTSPEMIRGLDGQRVVLLDFYEELYSSYQENASNFTRLTQADNRLQGSPNAANQLGVYIFLLGLSASLTSGLGANLATNSPDEPWGWIMIGFSVLNSSAAFLLQHVAGTK